MGAFADLEERFDDLKGSSRLEEAFRDWASRREPLGQFAGPEEMIAFLRDKKGTYEDRDKIIWALCLESRREAIEQQESQARRGRVASDLLLGLFVPALWRIFDEANGPHILDPQEIEAEILLGFWEAVRTGKNNLNLSGALINTGRHRAWKAVERAAKDQQCLVPFDEDQVVIEEKDGLLILQPEWSDPWVVVCWARLNDVMDEIAAELIFWTRLQDRPLKAIAPVLNLSYEAARHRRSRAEKRLRDWLDSGQEFPPTDPDMAEKVLALAQQPPRAHWRG